MSKLVRIQAGHYPRKTGSTGAWNASKRVAEQAMNKQLSDAIAAYVRSNPVDGVRFEFIGADERRYGKPDMFIPLHMDGSNSKSARGGSLGFPPSSKTSAVFAALLKKNYQDLGLPSKMRANNYTRGLQRYYAWKASYSGTAPVKVLLENGFVTNDADLAWAQANMDRVAKMIVDTIAQHYGAAVQKAQPLDPNTAYKLIAKADGGTYSEAVELWQQRLNDWGASVTADGYVGLQTLAAHELWSATNALTTSSRPGRFQWRKLMKQPEDVYVAPVVVPEPEPTPVEPAISQADLDRLSDRIRMLTSDLALAKTDNVLAGNRLDAAQRALAEMEEARDAAVAESSRHEGRATWLKGRYQILVDRMTGVLAEADG